MAEYRERSGLFKFFYIILRIITFPLFVAIYVLKHPLWVLSLLFLAFCLAVYYPLADVPEWYKNKYAEVRSEVVKKAAESDNLSFMSQSLQEELKREAEEDSRPKSENYNKKIMREDKIEAKTSDLKKRGGFKKKNVKDTDNNVSSGDENKEDILKQSQGTVGGLADVLKGYRSENNKEEGVTVPENADSKEVVPLIPELAPDLLSPVTQNNKPEKTVEEEKSGDDEFDLF